MSNPPFGSPLYREDDDFSFLIEAPNNINNNPLIDEEITLDCLPNTSLPMLDYQDLRTFLDDVDDFGPLIGQETSEWARQIEQVGLDQVVQGAEASSSGHEINHRPIEVQHDQAAAGDGEGYSTKKLAHNAKERVRRLKLNASYLALRSMLPESKRAKEKWSAPYIIDRTIEHIPQLEAEIEKLTLEKSNMLSVLGKKQVLASADQDVQQEKRRPTLTVSINEVKRGEVIIQICQQQKDKVDNFSTLIGKLEGEGMQIMGASSVYACQDRTCFHLHVQISEVPLEADYVADLHKKLIAWLS